MLPLIKSYGFYEGRRTTGGGAGALRSRRTAVCLWLVSPAGHPYYPGVVSDDALANPFRINPADITRLLGLDV